MARPIKTEHEKRTETARFRVTAAEREHIRTQARAAGISETDYLRARALGYQVPVASARSSDPALISEINRIGVNVNQLTRAVHMDDRESTFTAEWRFVLSELRQALGKVAGAYGS